MFKEITVNAIVKTDLLNSENLKVAFYCVNTAYLVDKCICPAHCRSLQILEKNILNWALAGTGSENLQVAIAQLCHELHVRNFTML